MRIIYKNIDESVAVLVPVQEVLDTVGAKNLAEKDVPQDLPYWIVEDSEVPSDRADRDRWILEDMPEPDGFGGTSNEFTDEQLMELYKQGAIE